MSMTTKNCSSYLIEIWEPFSHQFIATYATPFIKYIIAYLEKHKPDTYRIKRIWDGGSVLLVHVMDKTPTFVNRGTYNPKELLKYLA